MLFRSNGTERVVVSQLVRSPGVYFEATADKTSDKDIYSARVIPSRGAWLEFEIDKRDQVGVRIDRKRKQSVTVFLKALGLTSEEILSEFAGYQSIELTLEKDAILTKEEALSNFEERVLPLLEAQAQAEAKRCMSCGQCFECDNCVVYCPQTAVFKVPKSKSTTGRYVDTDYDKCIGCHICKDVCPTGYIQMGLGE